jgi:hypothetical protein
LKITEIIIRNIETKGPAAARKWERQRLESKTAILHNDFAIPKKLAEELMSEVPSDLIIKDEADIEKVAQRLAQELGERND